MKNKRSFEPELIDLGPSFYTNAEYDDCLSKLNRIGRFLGGDRATLHAFKKLSLPKTILDVGCGGGQFTIRLAQIFPKAKVTGIDISKPAIAYAKQRLKEVKLRNLNFESPQKKGLHYPPDSFDVITTTLVCHHMDDHQLVEFLKESTKIAKRHVIINDLHRHPLAYAGFALIAKPFFSNRLIYHDGLLSIKKAFTRSEWKDYLAAAKIPSTHYSLTWHWAFRWILHIDTSYKHQ